MQTIKTAFVTGATGLLGNNLVKLLLQKGVHVKALVRSAQKAQQQFKGFNVELVVGDMLDVNSFAEHLEGVDILFHTAAFFRDNYKGGTHWKELYSINVEGSVKLMEAAYAAGVRRAIHVSSIAVLDGPPGAVQDESMSRSPTHADDYYRSKIYSEEAVKKFGQEHPDMLISFVLPGWMFGPGDIGPTSAGQFIDDFIHSKLPGIPPGAFSVVDARDVAEVCWQAAMKGKNGERYLAAGRSISMKDLCKKVEKVSGIQAPQKPVPLFILFIVAFLSELMAKITKKPALLSLSSVKLIKNEVHKSQYSYNKIHKEFGMTFRPMEETLSDTVLDRKNIQPVV